MKKLFFILAVTTALSYTTLPNSKVIPMQGVYKMLSQVLTYDQMDSTISNVDQLKIYTSDFMMYANITVRSGDSLASFGIGSYTSGAEELTEHVIYSASDTSVSDQAASYKLLITKTAKGYKQIIPTISESEGRSVGLIEEYEKLSSSTKSPLDGAWKQIKAYTVNGTDTMMNETATQYKTYYSGHFIWGNTYKDSANVNHTAIGFGTFKMTGKNKLQETVSTSSYGSIIGQHFDIDIKMIGKDEFQQTGSFSPGNKTVELYRRLKK